MNNKGFGDAFFWVPLTVITYTFCWVFIFGPPLAQMGGELVVSQGMTGLEAFVWRTMNIWAGFLPLLAYIIYSGVYGGNQ